MSEAGLVQVSATSAQGRAADPEAWGHENVTPAERDQLEEERRERLHGWFSWREAVSTKAYTVNNISELEKLVEEETLGTVPDKEREADEGENEAEMRVEESSDPAGEAPSWMMGHYHLLCKYHVISTLPSSDIKLPSPSFIQFLHNCLSSYTLGMGLVYSCPNLSLFNSSLCR